MGGPNQSCPLYGRGLVARKASGWRVAVNLWAGRVIADRLGRELWDRSLGLSSLACVLLGAGVRANAVRMFLVSCPPATFEDTFVPLCLLRGGPSAHHGLKQGRIGQHSWVHGFPTLDLRTWPKNVFSGLVVGYHVLTVLRFLGFVTTARIYARGLSVVDRV